MRPLLLNMIARTICPYNAATVLHLVLALSAALTAAAQPPDSQTGASRVALAIVTDLRNQPLIDVSADDFVIQEGGTAREILSVRPADYPIIVMLDTGKEGHADFPQMRKAVARFIERIGQRPLALGTFGNAPKLVTSFEAPPFLWSEAVSPSERGQDVARIGRIVFDFAPQPGDMRINGPAADRGAGAPHFAQELDT